MSKQTKLMIVIAIIAAAAGLFVSKNYFNKNTNLEFQSLLVYPNKKTFTGFKLQSHDNDNLTIEDFAGKWTLIFFGFTHCPDVCPTTLTELQKVIKLMEDYEKPEVLFISVDPDRDTPEHLHEYTKFFHPDFKSATADSANILAITSQIGVAYHIDEHEEGATDYSVDHTTAIFLVSPNKHLYGIFRFPHIAQQIADDLKQLLEKN